MRLRFKTLLSALLVSCCVFAERSQMTNVVCFVRFADEDDSVFVHSPEFYENMYNDTCSTANSVYNYFNWVSYRQLEWSSVIYPVQSDGSTLVTSYQDILERCEMRPYDETDNPKGFKTSYSASLLEHDLVGRVCAYLDSVIPDSVKLDNRYEGSVDNLTIIYSGNSETTSKGTLLWPHQDSGLYFSTFQINGCFVRRYLAVFDNANGYSLLKPKEINTGVLCHEMMHVLGAPDLYAPSGDGSNPVGTWDLMSDNNIVPQGLTAFTRWQYGKWIDEIPQIKKDGDYTLHPVGSETSDNVAYRIVPSKASSDYFMIEYRRKEGTFESGIPISGLVCYRISKNYSGNLGKGYEVYIFRWGGSDNYLNAVLSADIGFFEGNTDKSPFKYKYSDGRQASFRITNVSACGETISFHIEGLGKTDVEDVGQTGERPVIYNLYGVRVDESYHGVVIIDGKKYFQ